MEETRAKKVFYAQQKPRYNAAWQTWPMTKPRCHVSLKVSSPKPVFLVAANLIPPKHPNVTPQTSCISWHFHRIYVAPKILPWTSIRGNPAQCYRGHGGHLSLIPLGHQRFTSTSARSHNNLECFLCYGFWHLRILLFGLHVSILVVSLSLHWQLLKQKFLRSPGNYMQSLPPILILNSSRLSKGYQKKGL